MKCHKVNSTPLKTCTHQLPEPTTQTFFGAAITCFTFHTELVPVRRQTEADRKCIYTGHSLSHTLAPWLVCCVAPRGLCPSEGQLNPDLNTPTFIFKCSVVLFFKMLVAKEIM